MKIKSAVLGSLFIILSIGVGLLALEGLLHVKNLSMKNYDIEMWRYARELKVRSTNPVLGHEHKTAITATLQSVPIRLNEVGLRGAPLKSMEDHHRRILFLGSSITFGWGVEEKETVTGIIQKRFEENGKNVEVLNAGIGNYNSERYVELFLTKLSSLNPTDIVVHYFLRDAEVLDQGRGNWLLQNSQLAVTGWNIFQHMQFAKKGTTVDNHYNAIYEPQNEGFKRMVTALTKLSTYCKAKGIRMYLAMTPDVHNLKNYPFREIHSKVKEVAEKNGYTFVDLLPSLEGLSPEQIWSLPNDPHPNGLGHQKMAEALFPVLNTF